MKPAAGTSADTISNGDHCETAAAKKKEKLAAAAKRYGASLPSTYKRSTDEAPVNATLAHDRSKKENGTASKTAGSG
jgi:hypothetical protein